MKSVNTTRSAVRVLMLGALLAALCQSATAAVAAWKGQTADAK